MRKYCGVAILSKTCRCAMLRSKKPARPIMLSHAGVKKLGSTALLLLAVVSGR